MEQQLKTFSKGYRRRYEIALEDGLKCRGGCGQIAPSPEYAAEHWTIDHIIPRALGGSKKRANLQLMCKECNNRKGHGDEPLPKLTPRHDRVPGMRMRFPRPAILAACCEFSLHCEH